MSYKINKSHIWHLYLVENESSFSEYCTYGEEWYYQCDL